MSTQHRADLRFPLPPNFAARLEGRRVLRITRRGKYILAHLDDGQVLLCHLGMSGRILVGNGAGEPPGPHDHVILSTDRGDEVRFNDARRFGCMGLTDEAGLATHWLLRDLGPEPLGNAFSGPELARRLADKRTSIKAALIGSARSLPGWATSTSARVFFSQGSRRAERPIRFKACAGRASGERAFREVLLRAIEAGGSSLRDYVQADGELGYFQHSWAVYDREGEPCPGCTCDLTRTGGIRRIVQSNRATFYCGTRQR